MNTIKEIYQIGPGPSSSHTIGPWKACNLFLKEYPFINDIKVTLYGSLALTGRGHLTDQTILKVFEKQRCEVIFDINTAVKHPNTMKIIGLDAGDEIHWEVESVGGGNISINGQKNAVSSVYPHSKFVDIKKFCRDNSLMLHEYVYEHEKYIKEYLNTILEQMLSVVDKGLKATGVLPGRLGLARIAKNMYNKATLSSDVFELRNLSLMAFAYAASEENADGGMVVTAPTLGSSGVLPAVIKYYYNNGTSRGRLINALATASIFANIIKTNATISGAVGGCQAEIGTACSMAAAAIGYLEGLSINQIEYAAEIAMEHHLGLTCDPIGGYVMIPCIERNAVAAVRAMDAALLAKVVLELRANRISFDMIVETMKYTGEKLVIELKETSLGGLATQIKLDN
ncbi:MAG: L-serine ammonia-lyase, iron-sulfur-dependent, subunit alpha [Erysipelotrichaceae bacterium]